MDPGLRSFGLAALDAQGRILGTDTIETLAGEGRPAKGQGRASWDLRDRTRRTVELFRAVDEFLSDYEPDALVAEAGYGMGPDMGLDGTRFLAIGQALAAITSARLWIPLVWATQLEWRRTIILKPKSGRKGTYKQDEITAAVGAEVDKAIAADLRARGKSITLRHHALDAVGLGRWALKFNVQIRHLLDQG